MNKKFHNSIRRGIRQAEKRGVVVRMSNDESDLNRFYKLHIATRKKLGVLPQPKAFFKALFRHVISEGLGFIGLAELDGKVIAGIVFLKYGDTLYYKFNASDEGYLKKRPNHLVIWEAVRYACENNYKHLDFGRCSYGDDGLRTFKSRWGASEANLPYFYYPKVKGYTILPRTSIRYRAMQVLSHVVPKFVFEVSGAYLYKHFG